MVLCTREPGEGCVSKDVNAFLLVYTLIFQNAVGLQVDKAMVHLEALSVNDDVVSSSCLRFLWFSSFFRQFVLFLDKLNYISCIALLNLHFSDTVVVVPSCFLSFLQIRKGVLL